MSDATAEAGSPNSPRGAQAAIRALRLLKAVVRADEPPTLGELARQLELSRTTAHRLLAALESEGLVARAAGDQAYRPGPELTVLALQAGGGHGLRTLARPELERLSAESGETVTLELLVEDQALIVDEIPSRRLVAAQLEIGTRWPLHATSTGKAMLAALPPDELERHLARPLTARTPQTLTEPQDLRRELAAVRRAGYAIATEEIEPGYAAVGAAIVDPAGRPLAALSIGGPADRLSKAVLQRLGPNLASAAAEVSRRLAGDP